MIINGLLEGLLSETVKLVHDKCTWRNGDDEGEKKTILVDDDQIYLAHTGRIQEVEPLIRCLIGAISQTTDGVTSVRQARFNRFHHEWGTEEDSRRLIQLGFAAGIIKYLVDPDLEAWVVESGLKDRKFVTSLN